MSAEVAALKVIRQSTERLEAYIRQEKFAGFDPYDGLLSPLAQKPFIAHSATLRFGLQQIVKRSPFNLRALLRIPKGENPVTLGLCLQAYTYCQQVAPEASTEGYVSQAQHCLDAIERLQSKGFSGACWGYNFDWQARYGSIPAFGPTVVATGFVTNALFEYFTLTDDQRAFRLCSSAVEFIKNDIERIPASEGFCFSYSPYQHEMIVNATMKVARLLSQVYSVNGDPLCKELADETVRFVVGAQREDGSWGYSMSDSRGWADNFHTGYILDCLAVYVDATGDAEARASLSAGLRYYIENFFDQEMRPKYYNRSLYPIDATAAAQSILTLSRFGELKRAEEVAVWMIQHMQDERGFFYYQQTRWRLNRVSFMRWSNAWMFLALSYYLSKQHALV